MGSGFITGEREVSGMKVPSISADLNFKDRLGAVMVRWNINRNRYRVSPGIYALGNPGADSDVFVTANYKLTFDNLRRNLAGMNCWILVLDTKGVNVWCAAGKGTFSTEELVKKINLFSLEKIVTHRRLIVPQLGATGIAAHKVRERTGFNVIFGPVRAKDIKTFVGKGYRKDVSMTRVTFDLKERIKLVPNDFIYGKFYLLGAAALMLLLNFINRNGIKFDTTGSGQVFLNVFLAYLGGIVITPILLPYVPSRAFALKGFLIGTIIFACLLVSNLAGNNIMQKLSWFLIISTISSYMAMNFTGSTTFTSLSGVQKEMKIAVPLQISCAVAGIILFIISKII
jgi:hypothetical protein